MGDRKSLTFTEIKKDMGEIDSPTLSYHLKSLKKIIKQEENLYYLSDVGIAALNLIDRVDQSDRLKKSKRRFFIANVATIVCWTIILFVVPFTIGTNLSLRDRIIISISSNLVAQINFRIIWSLFSRTYKSSRPKHRNRSKTV